MKPISVRLLTFVLLAILPACSKKPVDVTGQIFVVTNGRENIKMGAVEVRVFSDDEFQTMAKAILPWLREEARKEAQQRIDADHMTSFIKEVMAMEESAANPIQELPQIRKSLVEETGVGRKLIESAIAGTLLQRGMAKLVSGATSNVTVTTDADGRFTVPITGKTWFLAAGQREVGKDTEDYIWVKSYEPPEGLAKPTMTISNDADIDTEDGLYAVLSSATGASGGLEEFRKVEVSDKMKELVAHHRQAANAAKVEAERDVADAKSKLPFEVQAKQAGAIARVVLAGKAIIAFVYCPAGTFMMGSPEGGDDRSSFENQVKVTLDKGFWLAKTEVTQAQWEVVMGANPSSFRGGNLPVENVSRDDTLEFIRKVNASGAIPDGWKLALPKEEQWEYACRAGEKGPYSGGALDEVAWHEGNSNSRTHEVGRKKANAWGLHDMHGNVFEWNEGGSRGGSWNSNASECRAASIGRHPLRMGCYLVGFRPALVPSE